MVTIKEKVAAFDALVKLLHGKGETVRYVRQMPKFEYNLLAADPAPMPHDVPLIEYRIRALGYLTIEEVLVALGQR